MTVTVASELATVTLQPPDQNPWYCLATVYGDAPEFRQQNRDAWNAWYGQGIDQPRRVQLKQMGLSGTWDEMPTPEFIDEIKQKYKSRVPMGGSKDEEPPDYNKPIMFSSLRFDDTFILSGYIFPATTRIIGCEFKKELFIVDSVFMQYFGIDNSIINNILIANDHILSDFLLENNYIRIFDLKKSSIYGSFYFNRNKNEDTHNVHSSTFLGNFFVMNGTEIRKIDYFHAVFTGLAQFTASMIGEATFWSCEFKSKTTFHGTKFLHRPPDFRSAKLHEATEWDNVVWPPIPRVTSEALAHIHAYEGLKQEMDRLKKTEDEQFFYRKELACRQIVLNKWSVDWFSSNLYEMLSEYGYSISKPLYLAALLLIALADCIWLSEDYLAERITWFQALGLSFSNIFSFVPIAKDFKFDHPNLLTVALSAVESLAGIVLLFLLGLALRNRFRLR